MRGGRIGRRAESDGKLGARGVMDLNVELSDSSAHADRWGGGLFEGWVAPAEEWIGASVVGSA